jgi:GPH family glycoside/pentoside/hexuronide:cation symporter
MWRSDVASARAGVASRTDRPVAGIVTQALYGLGAVSSGIKMRALSSFLLLYYNQVLGLSPTRVSLVITAILIFDAICDPVVGHFSDRFRSPWGRRHPFMYMSAAPLAVGFFLLWNPPRGLDASSTLWWLFGCLLVIRVADTFFELPSAALAPELIEDYDGRTRIVNFRIFFRTVAGLLVTVLGLEVFMRKRPDGSGGATEQSGYFGFSLTMSLIMFAVIIVSAVATHRFIPYLRAPAAPHALATKPGKDRQTFWNDARGILRNRSALAMLGVGAFQSIAAGTKTGLDLYFGLYFWELTQAQLSLMATLGAAGALIGAFAVGYVSRRLGKRRGTITCYTLGLVNGVVPVALRLLGLMPANGSEALFVILSAEAFFLGMLYVMSAVMMNSMLADVVEDVAVDTGQRSEGLLFSADQFFTKAVSGLGVMISGGVLAAIAFPRDAKPGAVDPDMVQRLGLLYLPTVVGMTLMAIGLLFVYRIDRARHEGNLASLRSLEHDHDRLTPELTPLAS